MVSFSSTLCEGKKLTNMKMEFSPYTLHPWHGIEIGNEVPQMVTAFIEIVPTDTVKYEIDKHSGWLKVDRPQQFSNIVPALYGFIPQTFCGSEVGKHCMEKTGKKNIDGDKDPLDILVLSEKFFPNSGFIINAIPIGGLLMMDKNEADDKIIAVMKGDAVYGKIKDVSELGESVLTRIRHYFLTYKDMPGVEQKRVEINSVYGADEAREVIQHSITDYKNSFANRIET